MFYCFNSITLLSVQRDCCSRCQWRPSRLELVVLQRVQEMQKMSRAASLQAQLCPPPVSPLGIVPSNKTKTISVHDHSTRLCFHITSHQDDLNTSIASHTSKFHYANTHFCANNDKLIICRTPRDTYPQHNKMFLRCDGQIRWTTN